jgi:type III restriction enzyme
MGVELKPFQVEAVQRLTDSFKKLLKTANTGIQVVFKSPTGSGKTVMVAELLEHLVKEDLPNKYIYIWASTNDLHKQSKEKLERYFRDSRYNLISLDNLTSDSLSPNTILFANWQSVNSTYTAGKKNLPEGIKVGDYSNIAMRSSESGRNLPAVLDKARIDGYEIILIVDEAHIVYMGKNSQKLVKEIIDPKLILEVSATPKLKPSAQDADKKRGAWIEIDFQDVVESGLIKEQVKINDEIGKHIITSSSVTKAVLEAALDKRKQLKRDYEALGVNVNPLVLIQLPNDKGKLSAIDIGVREEIEELLLKWDIKYTNKKLAIWVSEDKTNRDGVEDNDSSVEVLIFKQAIAAGWDCLRADVLVMLREIKSQTFEIQTVGRILRQLEAEIYPNPNLNSAYVYTNLGVIKISKNEVDSKMFSYHKNAKRTNFAERKNVSLPSVYLNRTDYHDFTGEFKPLFIKMMNEHFCITENSTTADALNKMGEKLEIDDHSLTVPLLADVVVQNLDEIDAENAKTIRVKIPMSEADRFYKYILRSLVKPYNVARSVGVLKTALYEWFAQAGFGVDKWDKVREIMICSDENQELFATLLAEIKNEWEEVRFEKIADKRTRTEYDFKIPEIVSYSEKYEQVETIRYALNPCYLRRDRKSTEKRFEDAIDKSNKVIWWYKNGEKRNIYFGIEYLKENSDGTTSQAVFYPDYIVRWGDGTIGIYDTKLGFTLENENARRKANILAEYISKHSDINQRLVGGLIAVREHGFEIVDYGKYDSKSEMRSRKFEF